jgi:hypothetical protein
MPNGKPDGLAEKQGVPKGKRVFLTRNTLRAFREEAGVPQIVIVLIERGVPSTSFLQGRSRGVLVPFRGPRAGTSIPRNFTLSDLPVIPQKAGGKLPFFSFSSQARSELLIPIST